ncbi:MAG: two-component system, NtrC family, response regulator AtoC [Bryobacterales bacterium]|jgi:DNA-binding NtrC family response regulator|nr:two-component system, NtrC family, response regulator AtoC [Bryobacterales bacterium]
MVAKTPVKLVAVDDDPLILDFIETALKQPGVEIHRSSDPAEGWELIRLHHPDIVILDLVMPKISGMDLLEWIMELDSGIDVVLLSSDYSTENAVEAIQKGACDYLTKPITPGALRERIGALIAVARTQVRAAEITDEMRNTSRFGEMVGGSPLMIEVYSRIRRIGPHYRIALVTGATGTGKELVARSLHQSSPASGRPFLVCNCAAIVETLFESELFGYVKGAFTGATQDRAGLFEAADGGTLFLDEIGEIPLHLQSKLLRVLQNNEVQRVGSHLLRKVDVRVIAATNRDLRELASKKLFREDLFYRLSMLEIRLPTLAERKEDVPLLQRHFLELFAAQLGQSVKSFTRRAQSVLSRYFWPGNIRELQNVIGHACMMSASDIIDIPDLPAYLHSRESSREGQGLLTLQEVEKRHVHAILGQVNGNKQEAAEILGISRATIYRILSQKEPE